MNKVKYRDLLAKKKRAQQKLKSLYLEFKGVWEEDPTSALKDSEIKVLEVYIKGIERELADLEKRK